MSHYPKIPSYEIIIDGNDISELVRARLVNLSLTDNCGFQADQLQLTLDDSDGRIALPRRGSHVAIAIGWKDEPLYKKGIFHIDEIEHSGAPDVLVLRASSAKLGGSLQQQREQSYEQQTLGSLIDIIAKRHALSSSVDKELSHIEIPHIDQQQESDIAFMTRLGQQYDALATIKNETILLMKNGKGRSVKGKPLPEFEITRSLSDKHRFSANNRSQYTGIVARWQDERSAEINSLEAGTDNHEAIFGSSDNLAVLREIYSSKEEAMNAAHAEWTKIKRSSAKFNIKLALGEPRLFPEVPIRVSGWKPEIDSAKWVARQVRHDISESGFTTAINLESLLV